MKDTMNIFTCRARGQGHQQTSLTIDWEGMGEDELRLLARSCIIHALQHRWRQQGEHVPETAGVKGIDFVKGNLHDVIIDHKPLPPRERKVEDNGVGWLDKMLAAMSPEERNKLLGAL